MDIKLTENGITFPDEGCVLGTCNRYPDESLCYCEARLTILELAAAGRCVNCGRLPDCACHADGCPGGDLQEFDYFHACEEASSCRS